MQETTPEPVKILYRNYRGEVAIRTIIPNKVWHGTTSYHPEPQWFLEAFDADREADRDFAMRDIMAWWSPDANDQP